MSSLKGVEKPDIVSVRDMATEIRTHDRRAAWTARHAASAAARGQPPLVDDVDRQIIRLLQRDGRASNTEIGRALGLTETTIRKRVARLVNEGLISIVAVPTPAAVGMTTSAIIGISVQLQHIHEVSDQLGSLPEVR